MGMSAWLVVGLVNAVALLLGRVALYALCAFIVTKTGGTAGLRDLATVVRALKEVLPLRRRS